MKKLECCGAETHSPVCKNCGEKKCPASLYNGDFCEDCMVIYVERHGQDVHFSLKDLKGARKCAIPGCSNTSCQGLFVGLFCAPCHNYIIGKSCGSEMNPSQAYRNELVKHKFRAFARSSLAGYKIAMSSAYGKFGR